MSERESRRAFFQELWYRNWVDQGREDVGTCTVGNCIEIVGCGTIYPPVQGNQSAWNAAQPLLEVLEEEGCGYEYISGRMD
jgi:hypothetical protein|tara:strand:- start:647 stop:889 length:243 start_codon:yes stop_codon:yes gene_type:complete